MSNIIYTVPLKTEKSQAASFFLTLFFGPLGAFYASVATGLLTLLISVVVAVVTLGFGLLITWPMTIIWAAIVVSNNNSSVRFTQMQMQQGKE